MKIEVSNADILDKFSILEIKSREIFDPQKLKNVKKEKDYLLPIVKKLVEDVDATIYQESVKILYLTLLQANIKIWEVEDKIRDKHRKKEFDEEFIELAKSAYVTNDLRCKIKRKVNIITKSEFVEEKSYDVYQRV